VTLYLYVLWLGWRRSQNRAPAGVALSWLSFWLVVQGSFPQREVAVLERPIRITTVCCFSARVEGVTFHSSSSLMDFSIARGSRMWATNSGWLSAVFHRVTHSSFSAYNWSVHLIRCYATRPIFFYIMHKVVLIYFWACSEVYILRLYQKKKHRSKILSD
jgi:hypothetical protein